MPQYEGTAVVRITVDLDSENEESAADQLAALIGSGMIYFPNHNIDNLEVTGK